MNKSNKGLKGQREECLHGSHCQEYCKRGCKEFVSKKTIRKKTGRAKKLKDAIDFAVKRKKATLYYDEDTGRCELRFQDGHSFICSGSIVDEAIQLMGKEYYGE